MGLKNQPLFREWLRDRRRRDREAGVGARGETHCQSCLGELDDSTDEGDTCLVCLAVEYGRHQAETEVGLGLAMLYDLLDVGESAAIGAAVTEIAVHAAEVIVLPPREEGLVGRRH